MRVAPNREAFLTSLTHVGSTRRSVLLPWLIMTATEASLLFALSFFSIISFLSVFAPCSNLVHGPAGFHSPLQPLGFLLPSSLAILATQNEKASKMFAMPTTRQLAANPLSFSLNCLALMEHENTHAQRSISMYTTNDRGCIYAQNKGSSVNV